MFYLVLCIGASSKPKLNEDLADVLKQAVHALTSWEVCVCVCVCGRGGGGRGFPIYGIIRMCVPNGLLFQRCQVNNWPPFFNKKYMTGPIFLDSHVKGPIFLTSWYMHIFFAQRFFEAAYPLGIT